MDVKDLKIGDYVYINFIRNNEIVSTSIKNYFQIGFFVNCRDIRGKKRLVFTIGNFYTIRYRDMNNIISIMEDKIVSVHKINNLKHDSSNRKIICKRYESKCDMTGWIDPNHKYIKQRQERIKNSPPEKKIELLIERLAEINCASTMIGLGDNLCDERKMIVELLVDEKFIELGEKGSGGFQFIGNKSDEHKNVYLEMFNNF